MSWKALPICGLLLMLSACSLDGGSEGGAPADGEWTVSHSTGGAVELAHPSSWRVVESGDRALALESEQGCLLEIQLTVGAKPADRTQSEVLDEMLAEAESRYQATGGSVDVVGRRVWLGQNFIWHEIHYVATAGEACPQCRSGYTIQLLAFPNDAETLRARFVCPGSDPPGEEAEQLLLDVINTVTLGSPGST